MNNKNRENLKYYFLVFILGFLCTACNRQSYKARLVLLPDTQTYAEKFPEILHAQADYIVREASGIQCVLQQGDLTQNNSEPEWQVVKAAFSKLDNKVPYILAAGNHDMGSVPGQFADVRNTELYNRYFPQSHMQALPGFGGVYENGKMENAYYLFQTGKIKWLVLTLEFGPRNSVLTWADQIIQQHPDKTVIINTHSYLYSDSTRQGPGDSWRPQNYGVGKDRGDSSVNDGEQIWDKLVKKHPNVRFVFSGHILNTGVGTLVSINEAGLPVYQMLANYQEHVKGSVNGGNGYLRILDFDFRKQTIRVSTYSPHIKEEMNHPAHRFIIRQVLFEPGLKNQEP